MKFLSDDPRPIERPDDGLADRLLHSRTGCPLLLKPEKPLHDTLRGPVLLRPALLPAQGLQHQLEIHMQLHPGRRRRWESLLPLLQQLQRHIGPPAFPLLRSGQQFLAKGLGQCTEGREGQPLPGEYPHIRFCHSDRFHQKHPLWISSMRLTATLAWLLLSWGPTYFCR